MPKDQKLPIFHATKSLNVNYRFDGEKEDAKVVVEGSDIHARLYAGYKGLLAKRAELKYTADISGVNIATAAITCLYTDTSPEEGYLGESVSQYRAVISVSCKNQRILSSKDFYEEKNFKVARLSATKSERNPLFNQYLGDRVESFSGIAINYDSPFQTVKTTKQLEVAINGEMFHETFHHSEQAMMHYISSAMGINALVKDLVKNNAGYLYGIVLDIYTHRMVCCNCNACLLGLQNSHKKGFLADLSESLQRSPVHPRANNKIMLNTRVSASSAGKGTGLDALRLPKDAKTVHEYNPDKVNEIFQAENRTLGTEKIITDNSYSLNGSAFFLSSSFSKKKLEKAIQITTVKKPKQGG